jgi:hypothetical protein
MDNERELMIAANPRRSECWPRYSASQKSTQHTEIKIVMIRVLCYYVVPIPTSEGDFQARNQHRFHSFSGAITLLQNTKTTLPRCRLYGAGSWDWDKRENK